MTLLPLRQGCAVLGIDAKTLRHWMQQANLSLHPHPNDARIKCVTSEHLEQLAVLHRRPVDVSATLARLRLAETETCSLHLSEHPIPQAEPALFAKLAHLETQVALLQQQVAAIALELLQERTQGYEQRLHALEASLGTSPQHDRSLSALPTAHEQRCQSHKPLNIPRVHPAKGRPRALLPLIEYTAVGIYIVICPERGELALTPDSPEWFAWLQTLSSLRFLGQQGRWSAYRDKRRAAHGWFAYRRIRGHQYVHALGSPHELTITRFEQMAATFQSYATTS